jgi:uncharacterized protein YxjI
VSYPLTLRFKVLAIARQLSVLGSDGRLLMYAKMKAFKLKESITLFADEAQTKPLYRVEADRIIDFSATYNMVDASGGVLGAIRQKGMRSMWRSRYEILRDGDVVFTVQEENPWAKVADAWFEGIPLIGMLSGYVFHPRYLVTSVQAGDVVRVTKQPALFESAFGVERLPATIAAADERLLLIGTVVMVLLERGRG